MDAFGHAGEPFAKWPTKLFSGEEVIGCWRIDITSCCVSVLPKSFGAVVKLPLNNNSGAERIVNPITAVLGPLVVWVMAVALQTAVWAAQPQTDNCITCHLALGVENLTKPAETVQSRYSCGQRFHCVACHGGDANIMGLEAMDKKKGYIGKPAGIQVIESLRQVPLGPQFHEAI